MYTENLEQLWKTRSLITPLNEFNRATSDIFRRISQEQLEMISDTLGLLSNQVRRLSTIKKPEDFMTLQKDCINENITASIENMQKSMNLFMEHTEELTRLFTSLRDTAVSAGKSVAKSTAEKMEKAAEKERQK